MKQTKMSAEARENAGQRGKLSAYRASGRIPAVIYGLDKKPVSITVDEKAIAAVIKADPNAIITLGYPGGEDVVIIKAIQRHPVTDKYRHFDFKRISLTEKIEVKVHVKLVGECYGVKQQSGLVEHTMRELNVSCLPTEIPHEIVVDITELHINHALRVKDVKLGKFELLDNPEQIVVSVTAPKEEKVETPAAGAAPAEPELAATKGKKEEGAEGAAPAAGAKPAPGAKPAAGAAPAAGAKPAAGAAPAKK
ncbi:MAG: 50S ribosomal protein L25 [Elusimicrobia bacterium]|nr:50S ribosomal protein L25 [Elusimicrobiota bacterium]